MLHRGNELLHHLVVKRGHRAVEHFEDVEHVEDLGDVARRNIFHSVVLEKMIDAEKHPLGFHVRHELADVRSQALDLAMLPFRKTPDADMNALAGLGEVRLHLFTDEEILEVRILV